MTIKFTIHFTPTGDEKLFIEGLSSAIMPAELAQGALPLEYEGDSLWSRELNINTRKERIISYRYFVGRAGGERYYEAGRMRSIVANSKTSHIEARDQWTGNTADAPFLSAPFSDVFFSETASQYSNTHRCHHELIIRAIIPNIPASNQIRLVGNVPALGEWNVEKGITMTRVEGQRWEAYIPVGENAGEEWEYKFVDYNNVSGSYIWEEGDNRTLIVPEVGKHNTLIMEHSSARFGVSNPRFAGCAVPVFSLKSKKSHGVGDFADIRLLADWAKAAGLSVIQLLPINDTTAYMSWKDSYPYNCISTLALHPLYINLAELGEMKDEKLYKEFVREGKLLNHKMFLDYTEVWESKMRYCRYMYLQERENTFAEPAYYTFSKENKEWLYPYALFSALRDHFKTAEFKKWGKVDGVDCSVYSDKLVSKLSAKSGTLSDDIYFYVYLQYHLYKQMCKTKEYAHSCGVAIKGDIPIGISRCSVEAWQYPHLFNFSQSAGAPPDFFSKTGQNWGFPTYNWDKMAEDNYSWWKQRLTLFAKYFDAYRIDHILGFFRIWEVPIEYSDGRLGHLSPTMPYTPEQIRQMGVRFTNPVEMAGVGNDGNPTPDGLFIEDPYKKGHYHPMISAHDGAMYRALPQWEKEAFNHLHYNYFFHRHNELWYNNAMKKLQQLIAATNMLACGEDLGMLSESVTRCMNNLRILSLELMIMPKQFGQDLGDPAGYPYLSVCTTSTHDCETLRMWLGKRLGTTMGAVANVDSTTTVPITDALPKDCADIIRRTLAAPSMLAILPVQDWLSVDEKVRSKYVDSERINDPSNPNHYWRYRIHIPLEEMISAKEFNRKVEGLVKESGRR